MEGRTLRENKGVFIYPQRAIRLTCPLACAMFNPEKRKKGSSPLLAHSQLESPLCKYFEIQDDTGTIKVVTDKLLPTKGEKLKVTGQMTAIEIGTERWIVLREKSDTEGQRGK